VSARPKKEEDGVSEALSLIAEQLAAIDARLKSLEDRTETNDDAAEAARLLLETLVTDTPIREQKVTAELYARLNTPVMNKLSGAAVARKGRNALAGKRSGFVDENNRPDVKRWLDFCEAQSWNPERKAPPDLVASGQVGLFDRPEEGSKKKRTKKKGGAST